MNNEKTLSRPSETNDHSNSWNITPSFILRRSAIRDIIAQWPTGTFLECGTGTGAMTLIFLERGFTGHAYDVTIENLAVLRNNLSKFKGRFQTVQNLQEIEGLRFKYLLAFEVLEHIEDDYEALNQWTNLLETGGKLLFSVPARMKYFRSDDLHAGHVRRYEKSDIYELLESSGYTDIVIRSYGIPLMNLTRHIGAKLHRKKLAEGDRVDHLTPKERSIRSGVDRIEAIHTIAWFINDLTLLPFRHIQKLFYRLDFGEGYIVTAKKI